MFTPDPREEVAEVNVLGVAQCSVSIAWLM